MTSRAVCAALALALEQNLNQNLNFWLDRASKGGNYLSEVLSLCIGLPSHCSIQIKGKEIASCQYLLLFYTSATPSLPVNVPVHADIDQLSQLAAAEPVHIFVKIGKY